MCCIHKAGQSGGCRLAGRDDAMQPGCIMHGIDSSGIFYGCCAFCSHSEGRFFCPSCVSSGAVSPVPFLCTRSGGSFEMGAEGGEEGKNSCLFDPSAPPGGRRCCGSMAESTMDDMDGKDIFLLKKYRKNSISCVGEDDKTTYCMLYVNPLKIQRKVGKMCLIYREITDIMVDTSKICLVFYSNTERLGDEVCLMR